MATRLLLICLVIVHTILAGPSKFTFTSQPEATSVNKGNTVTLSCDAIGREGITYAWYQLSSGFSVPPAASKKMAGETGTSLEITESDISSVSMFQCIASSGDESIFSDVATVTFTSPTTDLAFSGTVTTESVRSEGDIGTSTDGWVFALECNSDTGFDPNTQITSGSVYSIKWYKDDVEVADDNKWIYTGDNGGSVDFNGFDSILGPVNLQKHSLVIFNIKTDDTGTYDCKAVNTAGTSIKLGTVAITEVGATMTDPSWYLKTKNDLAVGYTVKALNSDGTIKTAPNTGDEVTLSCGGVCRPAGSTSNAISYRWLDSSSNQIATTREHTLTISTASTVEYTCRITTTDCKDGSPIGRVSITATDSDSSSYSYTYDPSLPSYIWWESASSKSADLQIACTGSGSGGTLLTSVYHNGGLTSTTLPYTIAASSANSGAYQCGTVNNGGNVFLKQHTTEVLIIGAPTASLTSSATTYKDGNTAILTCTVSGHPIKSVQISFDSTDQTTTKVDSTHYTLEIGSFSSANAGTYTCVTTIEWYETDSGSAQQSSANDELTLVYVKDAETTLNVTNSSPKKGDTITFTCTVVGYPAPTNDPIFTKDGNTVIGFSEGCTGSNTQTCKHRIENIQYTNGGTYKCTGSNEVEGQTKSSEASVSVTVGGVSAVTMTLTQSSSTLDSDPVEIDKGSSLTITCFVDGSPKPENVSITKDGASISGTETEDSYSRTIVHTISSLTLWNSGVYKCTGAHNGNGQDPSVQRTVSVISPANVTIMVHDATPDLQAEVSIVCVTIGGYRPTEVILKKGGTELKKYTDTPGFCAETNDYTLTCTHKITSFKYTDNGDYQCTATNPIADSQTSSTQSTSKPIAVSKAVEVSMNPASATDVDSTSSDSITCNVDGGAEPYRVTLARPNSQSTLEWPKDGPSTSFTCSEKSVPNILECTYQLIKQDYTDNGTFTCTGYNRLVVLDTEKTDAASVEITITKDVAVTLSESVTSEVAFGGTLSLSCTAVGGRTPHYMELERDSTTLVKYDEENTSGDVNADYVTKSSNKLVLEYVVSSVGYVDDGSYKCTSENKAFDKALKSDEQDVSIVIVKDVAIEDVADQNVDYGNSVTVSFDVEGGREPKSVTVTKGGSTVFDWSRSGGSGGCSGDNTVTCDVTILADAWSKDGVYQITAKNNAAGNIEMEDTDSFSVTVFKDAVTKVTKPSGSQADMTFEEDYTIICTVEGGRSPNEAVLKYPDGTEFQWTNNGISNGLTCSKGHIITCSHTFTPNYDSDGTYTCTGKNEGRDGTKSSAATVDLTTIQETTVEVDVETFSVLTDGLLTLRCTVSKKPAIEETKVNWKFPSGDNVGEGNFTRSANGPYSWIITLNISNPSTEIGGAFICDADGVEKKVQVTIAEKEFLELPWISFDPKVVEKDGAVKIKCTTRGFPTDGITLALEVTRLDGGVIKTLHELESTVEGKSKESVFEHTASCDDFEFTCTATVDGVELKDTKDWTEPAPTIDGCTVALPVAIGGGVGGFILLAALVLLAVFFIVRAKRRKTTKTPLQPPRTNGASFRNQAYTGSPTPVGGFEDSPYATIDDTIAPERAAYFERKKKEDEAYAVLKPTSSREIRVPKNYKPMRNRPKHTMPQLEPSYVTNMGPTNPPKDPNHHYADMGTHTSNRLPPSQYADTGTLTGSRPPEPQYSDCDPIKPRGGRIQPSEYSDCDPPKPAGGRPPPPGEEPVYSRIAAGKQQRQKTPEPTSDEELPPMPPIYGTHQKREEDPLYSTADPRLKEPRSATPEPEDLPPEVIPIYGSMADNAKSAPEEEDPYATVEFHPRQQRPPARPKREQETKETTYATIDSLRK